MTRGGAGRTSTQGSASWAEARSAECSGSARSLRPGEGETGWGGPAPEMTSRSAGYSARRAPAVASRGPVPGPSAASGGSYRGETCPSSRARHHPGHDPPRRPVRAPCGPPERSATGSPRPRRGRESSARRGRRRGGGPRTCARPYNSRPSDHDNLPGLAKGSDGLGLAEGSRAAVGWLLVISVSRLSSSLLRRGRGPVLPTDERYEASCLTARRSCPGPRPISGPPTRLRWSLPRPRS